MIERSADFDESHHPHCSARSQPIRLSEPGLCFREPCQGDSDVRALKDRYEIYVGSYESAVAAINGAAARLLMRGTVQVTLLVIAVVFCA